MITFMVNVDVRRRLTQFLTIFIIIWNLSKIIYLILFNIIVKNLVELIVSDLNARLWKKDLVYEFD